MDNLSKELETPKNNVLWLLEHESGSVDCHGLSYWAKVVENLREKIKESL